MLSFILKSLADFIEQPLILIGLIAITVGIAVFCSARNIARTVRKSKDVKSNDKAFIIPFTIGILLLCGGLLCAVMGMYQGL